VVYKIRREIPMEERNGQEEEWEEKYIMETEIFQILILYLEIGPLKLLRHFACDRI
jgi:hypothetical protein